MWALLLGSVTAVFQFFLGSLITPGGFGLSRWMSGFVDIVSLPVLVPLIVYFVFIMFRVFSGSADFANFALLWLIPQAVFRAISWSPLGAPVLLVLAPLLWTALAAGIPFFIDCIIRHTRWYVIFPAGLCILTLPFLAATAWWAFFSQRTAQGFLLLTLCLIPATFSVVLDFLRTGK